MTDVFTRESAAASKDKSAVYARKIFRMSPQTVCVIVSTVDSGSLQNDSLYTMYDRALPWIVYVNISKGASGRQWEFRGSRIPFLAFTVALRNEDHPLFAEAMKEVRKMQVLEAMKEGKA